MASFVVRTLRDLGSDFTLSPERQRASALATRGDPLGLLVTERNERMDSAEARRAIVIDTTHTKDGILDLASARRASAPPRSAKKVARAGDLLVSRLRPYLRQIAFVHPAVIALCGGRSLACSTEYYVLTPKPGERLEYLVPFLLAPATQAVLAAGQEGGHHPRVPQETLLALSVPRAVVQRRASTSAAVHASLGAIYRALGGFQQLLEEKPSAR